MYRGNVDHGPMSPDNRIEERPFDVGGAGRTPIQNLFLCGSGIHPGGLVSGRTALNAVRVMVEQ
jgi:phytoene dehydrogenase-like protein